MELAELNVAANATQQTDLRVKNYYIDGIEALDEEDYDNAVRSFKKAIELDPANLEFQYYLGITYARMDRNKEALEIFESIVEREPVRFLKAFFDIAALYSKQKMYQQALEALGHAEEIDPKNARVFLEKGYAYNALKEYEQAIDSFNRARELDPKLTQTAYYNIGATSLAAEKFDRAADMFAKAAQINPKTRLAKAVVPYHLF